MTAMSPNRYRADDARRASRSSLAKGTIVIRGAAALVFAVFGAAKFVNHASELASFRLYGLPAPEAFVYLIGTVEIAGGLLLASGRFVRGAATVLAGDMIGAIVVSGIGRGEYVSLTLAPLLLVGMVFLIRVGGHPDREPIAPERRGAQ
jgi:uncharacterized membrane protein YphA (DoxX/SURF4 family)